MAGSLEAPTRELSATLITLAQPVSATYLQRMLLEPYGDERYLALLPTHRRLSLASGTQTLPTEQTGLPLPLTVNISNEYPVGFVGLEGGSLATFTPEDEEEEAWVTLPGTDTVVAIFQADTVKGGPITRPERRSQIWPSSPVRSLFYRMLSAI